MILDGPSGLCSGACLGFEFLNQAKSQNYYPRYGFNEHNQPVTAHQAGLYPTDQLRNSVAVVWDDSDKAADEGWRLNRPRERCYKLMRKHGVPMNNGNQQFYARAACDQFWFLDNIFDVRLEGHPLSANTFIAGVNGLGRSYMSTSAYGTNFSPAQHDGIAAVRNIKFVDSCNCYRYTSDPYRV